MKGWISLHRELSSHWIYPKDREFTEYEAWIDLLLEVNYKPKKVRIKNRLIECGRGQSLRSIKGWAERWGWTRSKVYRFFELLESDKMIETVSETVSTRLTICNYDSYQIENKNNETQTERKRNADETRADTNNKDNNTNKGNKRRGAPAALPHELTESEKQAIELSAKLLEGICYHNPEHKYTNNPPELKSNRWMKEIDRALRVDNRTYEQIDTMITLLFYKQNEVSRFWAPNIQSGTKLREKFDTIAGQFKTQKQKNGSTNDKQRKANNYTTGLAWLERQKLQATN